MTWIAVVHIASFPIAVARRDSPHRAHRPLLLIAEHDGQAVVVAASDPAVTPGLALHRARLRCPDALVHPHEPERDQAALFDLRAALGTLSPRVALLAPPPDVALAVDLGHPGASHLTQIAHLLAERVRRRLGVVPSVGLATRPTVAQLAARVATAGEPEIVSPGMEAAWLAPRPLDLLPIDEALVWRLQQFGLRTIGAVTRLPCDALEAQFGRAGRMLFELAHGRDPLPFAAPPDTPPLVAGRRFAGPVTDAHVLAAALARLAERLAHHLLHRGQAARRLTLSLTPAHGPPVAASRTLAEPASDPARLQALLLALLRGLDLRDACESLTVTLEPAALMATQHELFAPEVTHAARLEQTLTRLAAKHGAQFLRATLARPDARCLEQRVRLARREER
ncbi:MAG: hypothetical protein DIU80_009830 [Chloroflexota bacterium]